jgi:hypothetical protein
VLFIAQNYRKIMRNVLFIFILIVWQWMLSAQQSGEKLVAAAANPNVSKLALQAPRDVVASDGTYDKFVLIRWEPSENATTYKVFRTNSPKATSLQEISNAWQKSTWLCDYSALPNVDYYYTVVASNGKEVSSTSMLDKGFLKKSGPMVIEERELLADADVYGAQKQLFLLIAEAVPDRTVYTAGATVQLDINFQNIFDQPTPRSEIRYFLSEDAILDWNDRALGMKSLSGVPANARFTLIEKINLPNNLLSGNYHIIIVSSTEGAVLSSKTAVAPIKIVN